MTCTDADVRRPLGSRDATSAECEYVSNQVRFVIMEGFSSSAGRGRGQIPEAANQRNSRKKTNRNVGQFLTSAWGKASKPPSVSQPPGHVDEIVHSPAKASPSSAPGLSKFEEACAKIQESSKKFLNDEDLQFSDEEDEDELPNNAAVLDKVILPYTGTSGNNAELGRTRQFLEDAIKSGANVCLVCIATVKKTEAIWSCQGCYCILHLPCIQTWAKDSLLQQETLAPDRSGQQKWCCPKCRHEYYQFERPTTYTCFCKKLTNPVFDPWLVPHSCGQACGKLLEPHCGHKCHLLCHPGPCPSCPQTVQTTCHCRKEKPQTRRCSHKEWSCGNPCGQLRACRQHSCTSACHSGECLPCPKQSLQPCLCGKEKAKRPCADLIWQCERPCGRLLSCGHHSCEKLCHSGSCGECPRSKERSCPCGKTAFDLPCTEDIPTCGDTCGKLLACGFHSCSQRCHAYSCGLCLQMRVKKCRCGLREKSVLCHKEYLCDVKCKILKDCGRHPCNRKCCDGNCPSCEQPCGRTLGCRNHKCSSRCHPGPCYPCPLSVDVACFCGGTVIKVPCGREKVTRPPLCKQQCQIPPNCHHEKRRPHRCHFGDCPSCKQVCNKILKCSHICPVACHSAVLTKIKTEQKRAGPWEPQLAPRLEIVCKECPPCLIKMPVTCIGEHETQNFPCFMAKPSSCHRQCGRVLPCGNHECSLVCHHVINAPSKEEAGENCATCEERCSLPRLGGCTHECRLPCHPEPCPPCCSMFRQKCHCLLNTRYIECNIWTSSSKEEQASLLSCGDRCPKQMECGHRCLSFCHPGQCPSSTTCHKKVTLRCPCKNVKKDFPCSAIRKEENKVECDDSCKQKLDIEKKAREEELAKKKKEEAQRMAEELERYQRKLEGKKRKPRKQRDAIQDETFWTKHKWIMVISAVMVLLLAFGYMLLAK